MHQRFFRLAVVLAGFALTVAEGEDVTLQDFRAFTPGTAIRSTVEDSTTFWRAVQAEDSPSGWRLETSIKTAAPDIELPLGVKGIHAIYIGVYMPDSLTSGVLVRTDDDPDFFYVKGWCDGEYPAYHETFYKVVDCTGRRLLFRQPAEMRSYITHVRLVPRRRTVELPPATKEVLGLSCTFHDHVFYAHRESTTPAAAVKAHQLCGMTEMVFCCGRSVLTYETKVGTPSRIEKNRPRTRWIHYHAIHSKPLATALDAARRCGLKLSARLSMNCHYHGTYENALTSDFVLKHPQFHDKDRNGKYDYHRLCYGYPEVRAERVSIFREMVELGADHLFVDCRRYMPMSQWGDPLVQSFQEKYRVDPRTLGKIDKLWPVWLQHRADFFTLTVRQIKQMLRDIGRQDVTVTLRISAESIAKNLEYGVDVRQLVRERLVDRIVLGEEDPRAIASEYLDLIRGTDTRLLGCLSVHGKPMPGPEHHTKGDWPTAMYYTPDVRQMAQIVDDLYDLGLDGMAFYETDEGCLYPRLRQFFIACRRADTIKAYREKLVGVTDAPVLSNCR